MERPRGESRNPIPEVIPSTLVRGLDIIAARSLGDRHDAEEAVQETLARAIQAIDDGRVPEGVSLEAYVHGIARHVVADILRTRMRVRALEQGIRADEPPSLGSDPLQSLLAQERVDAVRAALPQLTASERGLLEDIFVRGERIADIARRSGIPAARLRKRKSRALRRLREVLTSLV